MSLFKSIGKAIGGIARAVSPIASIIPGGALVTGALGQLGMRSAKESVAPIMLSQPAPQLSLMPASFPSMMGSLPTIGRAAGTAVGAVGGMVIARGASIARSAMAYCRRNPGWCASIGGTAAVSALIESGQLPVIRRRRGRGITPRDLRSFRRVANLVRGYCPTVRRIPHKALHVRRTGITHA